MTVTKQKEEFADLLLEFHLRIQMEEKKQIDNTELAERMDIPRALMSRWHSKANNSMPSGQYGTRLINFFVERYGEEAMRFYEILEWDRPILPE